MLNLDSFHVELLVSENNNLKHKISNFIASYLLVELRSDWLCGLVLPSIWVSEGKLYYNCVYSSTA